MKKLIYISALCLMLCACASDTQSSSDEAVTTTITTTEADSSSLPDETSKTDDSSAPKPAERMAINAEVVSYKEGILTFKYEDKEYSLPFSRWGFDYDHEFYYPSLAESIINNKYGEIVYAKMSVAKDMSKIFKCDVVTPNGEVYHGENPCKKGENDKYYVDKELLYSFKRTDGTLCEISNINETLELDLNDLPMRMRLDYPETIDIVTFSCYQFKGGKTIFMEMAHNVEVTYFETDDEEAGVLSHNGPDDMERFGKPLGFFGVIQSVSGDGDMITFLLNDKKTLCTVPTYFNDGGELKEGTEIMVMLIADSSLFGSGGEHEFGYAVVYTDPEYYNQTGENNRYSEASRLLYLDPTTPVPSELLVDHINFDDLAYTDCKGYMFLKYTKVSEVK